MCGICGFGMLDDDDIYSRSEDIDADDASEYAHPCPHCGEGDQCICDVGNPQ